jgi:hypothetical protein
MTSRSIYKRSAFVSSRNLGASCLAAASLAVVLCLAAPIPAQQPRGESPAPRAQRGEPANNATTARQAELESAFEKMLSGATLEGSFTSTGRGSDPTRLRSEKYTIGEVKKLAPGVWVISARIEYGEHDVTLPVTVPIRWAGDTPVIVVDNQSLPGFGTVSARVMFFADHYAGYWKHGDHGGHLFGLIRREGEAAAGETAPDDDRLQSSGNSSRGDVAGEQQTQ